MQFARRTSTRSPSRACYFAIAFVNAPSCTPCRSSLLSGQHFWRTRRGAILQGAVWDTSIPTWPLLLEDAGYSIGYSFKVWSPGTPRDGRLRWTGQRVSSSRRKFNGFSQTATRLVDGGKTIEEAKQVLLDEVRGNFRAFLDKRKDNTPFSYWFGPTNVHRRWIKGSGKRLWAINPDDLKGQDAAVLPDVPRGSPGPGRLLREAQAFDAALGVLVEELKKAGEFDNTIIAISGDHGAPGFRMASATCMTSAPRAARADRPGHQRRPSRRRLRQPARPRADVSRSRRRADSRCHDGPIAMARLEVERRRLVDNERTHVFIGRERHVAKARAAASLTRARDSHRQVPLRAQPAAPIDFRSAITIGSTATIRPRSRK